MLLRLLFVSVRNILNKLEPLIKSNRCCAKYGFDISRPAENAGKLSSGFICLLVPLKENNEYAMSISRNTSFIDCYIQRDLERGLIDESMAQALVDN